MTAPTIDITGLVAELRERAGKDPVFPTECLFAKAADALEASQAREDVENMPGPGEVFLAEDQYGDWINVRRFDPGNPRDYSRHAVINGRTGRWWYPRRWRQAPSRTALQEKTDDR